MAFVLSTLFIALTSIIIFSKILILITPLVPVKLENEQHDSIYDPYDADVVESRYSRTYKVKIPGIKRIKVILRILNMYQHDCIS